MKITLSKSQWEGIGKKAGWIDAERPSGDAYYWDNFKNAIWMYNKLSPAGRKMCDEIINLRTKIQQMAEIAQTNLKRISDETFMIAAQDKRLRNMKTEKQMEIENSLEDNIVDEWNGMHDNWKL